MFFHLVIIYHFCGDNLSVLIIATRKETKRGGFNKFQQGETSKKCIFLWIRHWQLYALNFFSNYWLKKSRARPWRTSKTGMNNLYKRSKREFLYLAEWERKIKKFRIYFVLFSGKYFHPFQLIVSGLISRKRSVDKYISRGNSRAINNIAARRGFWGEGKCRE